MRGKLVALVLLLVACQETPFPEGLYHYQVERLLSGGSSKTWVLASSTNDGAFSTPVQCLDSLRLLITAFGADSINIIGLKPTGNCTTFDSTKYGNANASGDLLFTDSINFTSGSNWIITGITSKNLTLVTSESAQNWVKR